MTGQPYEQEWDVVPPGSVAPSYDGPPPGWSPYPPPGHGPYPPHGWGIPPAWPAGPGRPGVATAAAVLGIVAGSLSLLVGLLFAVLLLSGEADAPGTVLALGLPCGAALLTGGIRLLTRHSPTPLFAAALAAVAVLVLFFVVGAGTLDSSDVAGVTAFLVLALPLPVLTAVFARLPATLGWATAPR